MQESSCAHAELLYRYRRLAAACERGEPRSDELQVYADFLRIVLEILNTVITAGLPQNPELVYALLHRQEVFAPFQARSGLRFS